MRRRRSPIEAAGFTLVEVLVTLTIMGFVVLVTFQVFRLGISVWDRGEASREGYQKLRISSQLIAQQMKSLIPYKIKSQKAEGDFLAFEGKSRSVKFVSALSLKTRKPAGLTYVVYEFQAVGDSGRLRQYERRVVNKNFMEEDAPEEAMVALFDDLADIRCEYYREEDPANNREAGWQEEWIAKEEKELPRAVRMTLVPRKRTGGAEDQPIVIMASLPANRLDQQPGSGPAIRPGPPVTRQ
ncbi:MAG TPA: prepilin-type N-terminal cleavage/methylation domain-containing protein [Thermodesulfobacteriota bacterium]|nr:prepilin-type N-terminal cleavage/methylation domain-containing protein [Thermodesulfobacteriota bacterium]